MDGLIVFEGKKVFEIRPAVKWNKGDAVNWLIKNLAFTGMPIYLGDDTTDQDVFIALKQRGLSVWVGDPSLCGCADFYLHDTKEVFLFLRSMNA